MKCEGILCSRSKTEDINLEVKTSESSTEKRIKFVNWFAFWLAGVCIVYPYVVMLSAAHDVLAHDFEGEAATPKEIDVRNETNITSNSAQNSSTSSKDCNAVSTGAILVADSLPSLIIKILASFFPVAVKIQVGIAVLLSAVGYLLVAFAVNVEMVFLGVVSVSLCLGLGEAAMLRYTVQYHKNYVAAWAAGTGTAAAIGSLAYAGLTTSGLSPRHAILCMLVTPAILFVSFFVVLTHPEQMKRSTSPDSTASTVRVGDGDSFSPSIKDKTVARLKQLRPLFQYSFPLFLVYFAEYFINQGLYELMYFPGIWLSHKEQYRWYLADYFVAVFVSRSLGKFLKIRRIWIMPVLQLINVVIFLVHVAHPYFPNIWVVLALIMYEGVLGGASYVNILYNMADNTSEKGEMAEFSMMFVNVGEWVGIVLAGVFALPTHDHFCRLNLVT